jgi:hypothetical protein
MVTLADRGKHTRFGVHEEWSKNMRLKQASLKKSKNVSVRRERGDGGLPVLCC